MDNPGIKNLGDRVLTTALTGEVITSSNDDAGAAVAYLDDLDGLFALAVQFRFAYGSGGTSCKAYLQTSFDQGSTWVDIACAAFTTASATKDFNLSALTPVTSPVTPTDGSLADDTCVDGLLGDRFRVKVTSTGAYASNTSLSVRVNAR
jgi:hypothetical protein